MSFKSHVIKTRGLSFWVVFYFVTIYFLVYLNGEKRMLGINKKEKDLQATLLLDAKAILGEGPVWNLESGTLMWVDIKKGEIHRFELNSGNDEIIYKGDKVGCAVPTCHKELVVADKQTLFLYNPDSKEKKLLKRIEEDLPNNRFNDGKVDGKGRFWVGTMDENVKEGVGSLYRMDGPGEISTVLSHRTISNGMDWSRDHKTMYFIDSWDKVVYGFDYDAESGSLSNQRVVVKVPDELGVPDGMTLDVKGRLWVAMWGGACVTCWDPTTGNLVRKVEVPALNVSSCAFGGVNMDQLFITSARDGMSEEKLAKYPLSGGVFVCKCDTYGCPAHKVKM